MARSSFIKKKKKEKIESFHSAKVDDQRSFLAQAIEVTKNLGERYEHILFL